jgi:hypothetical protein
VNSPTPIAYIIETFKNRDDWIKLFLAADDDELSFTAKVVGVRIALHHNVKTSQCNPSLPQLAAGTGMSERNVRRMLRELEETGWLCTDQSLGRHTHSFQLTVPTNPDNDVRDQVSDPDRSVRVPDSSTRTTRSGIPGQTGSPNPDTVVRQKRESRTAKRKAKVIDSLPLNLEDEVSCRRLELYAAFEEFWAVYPLKKAKAEAAKAYGAVIKKKQATPAEVLAGAMRYAAERSGQDSKFTKHPATWLRAGCWADEPTIPATGITIDGNGIPISASTPPPNASSYSKHMTEYMMEVRAKGGVQ